MRGNVSIQLSTVLSLMYKCKASLTVTLMSCHVIVMIMATVTGIINANGTITSLATCKMPQVCSLKLYCSTSTLLPGLLPATTVSCDACQLTQHYCPAACYCPIGTHPLIDSELWTQLKQRLPHRVAGLEPDDNNTYTFQHE